MEEQSITNAKNDTVDTFSHAYSAQRENYNAIFTSEMLENSDELVDSVNNLTINDPKHYKSDTVTASDAQGDLTRDSETVTHTSNVFFEQKLLSCRTIPVLSPPTNSDTTTITLIPPALLTHVTKGIFTDVASGGTWASRTLRRVSKTGIDGSTPGGNDNAIGIVETYSPDLLGIIGTSPTCGINLSQEVGDI